MSISIRDFGVALIRHAPWLEKAARWAYACMPASLHDTPTTFLRDFFRNADTVRFVQIGAFDGVAGDPIRPLVISDTRWRGVLMEPQPKVFRRLLANYAAQSDRLTFLQQAISGQDAIYPFYFIPMEEIAARGLPDWAGEVASLDKTHVQRHFPEAYVERMDIPAVTLLSVIRQSGWEQIDLVVMDVEGHERTIIESIDWRGLDIKACVFEHKHMSVGELSDLEHLLRGHGFALKRYGRDTVAFRARK